MSAWHTPEDPREYSDAPLELACATPGCLGVVRIAAEDYDERERTYTLMCCVCVLEAVAAPHPTDPYDDGKDRDALETEMWF